MTLTELKNKKINKPLGTFDLGRIEVNLFRNTNIRHKFS